MKNNTKFLWVLVKVESGIPVQAEIFQDKLDAENKEKLIRKRMNLEKDETGLFFVNLNN